MRKFCKISKPSNILVPKDTLRPNSMSYTTFPTSNKHQNWACRTAHVHPLFILQSFLIVVRTFICYAQQAFYRIFRFGFILCFCRRGLFLHLVNLRFRSYMINGYGGCPIHIWQAGNFLPLGLDFHNFLEEILLPALDWQLKLLRRGRNLKIPTLHMCWKETIPDPTLWLWFNTKRQRHGCRRWIC